MATDTNVTAAERLTRIEAKIDELTRLHGETHKTLFGNGQPGLAETVTALKTNQSGCPAREAYKTSNRLEKAAIIISVLVAIASAIGAYLH